MGGENKKKGRGKNKNELVNCERSSDSNQHLPLTRLGLEVGFPCLPAKAQHSKLTFHDVAQRGREDIKSDDSLPLRLAGPESFLVGLSSTLSGKAEDSSEKGFSLL